MLLNPEMTVELKHFGRSIKLALSFLSLFCFARMEAQVVQGHPLDTQELGHFEVQNLGYAAWEVWPNDYLPAVTRKPALFDISRFPFVATPLAEPQPKDRNVSEPIAQKLSSNQLQGNLELKLSKFNVRAGLPDNEVSSLCTDDEDHLWLASKDRVFKMSGNYIKDYNYRHGWPDMSTTDICAKDGSIFISTFGEGLFKLTDNKLTQFSKSTGFASNHITKMVWWENHLVTSTFDQGLVALDGLHQSHYPVPFVDENERIIHLEAGTKGVCFVTNYGNIGMANNGQLTMMRNAEQRQFIDFFTCNEGNIYLATKDGQLTHWDGEEMTQLTIGGIKEIQGIFLAPSGYLWLAADGDLLQLMHGKVVRKFANLPGLDQMNLSEILVDRNFNLWFASENAGLAVVSPSNFLVDLLPQSLANQDASFLYTNKEGALLLEHRDGGLVRLHPSGEIEVLKHPALNAINGMAEVGNALYLTSQSGLFKLENGLLTRLFQTADRGFNTHMDCLKHDGALIINNFNFGLLRFDGSRVAVLHGTSTLTYTSYVDEQNRLWVANRDSGLSVIEEGHIRNYNVSNGFISNQTSVISGDQKGHVLVGTNRGLVVYDDGEFVRVPLHQGHADWAEAIHSLGYNPEMDCFWVNSGDEIHKVSKTTSGWKAGPMESTGFFMNGRLDQNSIATIGSHSCFLVDGKVVRYVPYVFAFESIPQAIKFLEVRTDSSVFHVTNAALSDGVASVNEDECDLVIDAHVQTIQFIFDVGARSPGSSVDYFYRLTGSSNEWIGPMNDNQLRIERPSAGVHTLEVKGIARDRGAYSNASIRFSVTPRVYENPLYILIFLAFCLFLTVLLIRIFSPLRFNLSESQTSLQAQLNKLRILSIISFLLMPVVAYFQSVVLEAYDANWPMLMLLEVVSFLVFLITFHKNITNRHTDFLLGVLFPLYYAAFVYMAFSESLPLSLGTVAGCMIPFTKVVYRTLRGSLVFLLYAISLNCLMIYLMDTSFDDRLTAYLSISTQCSLLVVALFLVEGASLSSLQFASKVLENAGLLIMVREKKGKIVFSNKYLRKIINRSEAEINGQQWWTLSADTQQERDEWDAKLNKAQHERLIPRIERLSVDGSVLDVRWQEFALDRENLISIGRDITNELDLQKEVNKLSEVAIVISNGVARLKKDGTIVWHNKSFAELCDSHTEELMGNQLQEVVKISNVFKGNLDYDNEGARFEKPVEIPILQKDQSIVWVLANSTPIYDNAGNLEEIFEIWTDITEEKRLKRDYSYIINNASDIIYTTDEHGHFEYVNDSVRELLGMTPESLIGKHFSSLLHPDDHQRVCRFYDEQLRERIETSFLEFKIITDAGNTHWIQQGVKLISNPDDALSAKGFQAVCRDITAQKEFEERHSFIVSNATDGIYTVNYEGFFTYVNEAMRTILGYDAGELEGKHFSMVVAPEFEAEVIEFYARQPTQSVDETYHEFMVVDKLGVKKWVGQNVNAVAQPNNPKYIHEFYSIVRDITERKKYEDELSRLSLVAQKTNNVILILDAHFDISWVNSAFTTVFGYSSEEVIGKNPGDLLNGKNTDPSNIHKVNRLLSAGERVTTEILNYTKDGQEVWMEISMDPIKDDEGTIQGFIAVEQEITDRKNKEELIQQQTKDIVDSITYSKRIQEATITSKSVIREIFPTSFLLYKPKDIVSGDFYMVERLNDGPMRGWPIFLVADCTGHGVPEAMLSVLCTSILKQAFSDPALKNTAQILDYTRNRLASFFETSEGSSNELLDGMDIAVCAIDEKNNQVHFSGANNPLWIVRGDKVLEFKGSRQHVGHTLNPEPFESSVIDLMEGDSLYIFSDGIIDQFGGNKGRRFMKRNLRKLLLSMQTQTPCEREKTLEQTFENWRGNEEQTDDVCLMGITISQHGTA